MNNRHLCKMCIVRKVRLAWNLACPLAHCYQVRRLGESLEDISLYHLFLRKKAGIMKSHEYQIWRIRDYLEENNERRILWTVCFLDRDPAWLPSASWQGSLTMCSWLKPHVCWICVPHLTSINKWLGGSGLICLPTQTTLFCLLLCPHPILRLQS